MPGATRSTEERARTTDRSRMPANATDAPSRPRARWLLRLWRDTGPLAALTVLAIAAASWSACLHLHRVADAADADRHRLLHREAAEEVRARVEAQRHALLGLAALFAADTAVSRDAFERAVAAMEPGENYPAARAFGFLRRVSRGEEEAFVAAVRGAGDPYFSLHDLSAPASAGDRLVVTYRVPPDEDRSVLGLDLGTDANRRRTAERAAATGEMALSAPLVYALGAEDGVGLLAALPVESRAGGVGLRSETGWVYAALLPGVLFEGLGGGPGSELGVSLVTLSGDGGGGPAVLVGAGVPRGSDEAEATVNSPLVIGGQRWTLSTRPGPGFERASPFGAWLVKGAGGVAAVLAFLLFRVPAMQRRRGRREGRREARRLAAEMTRELREAAETDALTGLPNRAAILGHIDRAGERSRRRIGTHHAVLFLDFDRFKELNDTRGHAAGDELLRRISGRLQAELRGGDTAARGRGAGRRRRKGEGRAVPARLGGDEFVVLLRDLAEPSDARAVAERLLERLSRPYFLSSGGPPVRSTPSIGVAVGRPGLEDSSALLAAADAAMYAAKDAGRACIRVHGAQTPAPEAALRLAA